MPLGQHSSVSLHGQPVFINHFILLSCAALIDISFDLHAVTTLLLKTFERLYLMRFLRLIDEPNKHIPQINKAILDRSRSSLLMNNLAAAISKQVENTLLIFEGKLKINAAAIITLSVLVN